MPRSRLQAMSIPSYEQEAGTLLKRAIYSAAVGASAAAFLFGESGETASLLNMSLSAPIVVGASVGVGSIISDLTSDYVINKMDESGSIKTLENTALKVGISGAATLISLKTLSGIDPSLNTFLVGATSKLAGDAVFQGYDNVLLGMLF